MLSKLGKSGSYSETGVGSTRVIEYCGRTKKGQFILFSFNKAKQVMSRGKSFPRQHFKFILSIMEQKETIIANSLRELPG